MPDNFGSLEKLEKSTSIQMLGIVNDFISVEKQNNPNLMNQLKALHQSRESKLKNIDFILRKVSYLSPITAKSRPKRHNKRARNAPKKTTATSLLSYALPLSRCCVCVQMSLAG